jgi:hypothetical protein
MAWPEAGPEDDVSRSADLYRRIEGWASASMA